MNVLLINPPAFNMIRASLPPVVEDSSGTFPPLGLLYVASYAERVEGCDVSVLDCQAPVIDYVELGSKLMNYQPDVVGIQVMTFTLLDAVQVARVVKKIFPKTIVVFGGPHPTLFPKETVELTEVDAVIVGEGEYPFQNLLMAMKEHHNIDDIPGVITKLNFHNQTKINKIQHINNLDELIFPARHLLDMSQYSSTLAAHRNITTMMSSRGCPGRCIFCDRPQMGKVFRKRSAENVVEEMRYCVDELGIGEIVFYDDTFTIDRKRVIDICDMIVESGLKVIWDIRARIDTMTPEVIHKLREAGCGRIHYGVETGNPRLQKLIKKNLDLNKVKEIFSLTRKEGIETLGYFMIGLPTETEAEMKNTLDMLVSLPMDYAHIALFSPYPGTSVYRMALQDGFYDHDYWKEFAQHPQANFHPKYWNEFFSDEELLQHLKGAYAKFYKRPSYIFRRLSKVRSIGELIRKTKIGTKLLMEV